jgi:deazaflavin-dependent oxidoreductase (nitroreductase family)
MPVSTREVVVSSDKLIRRRGLVGVFVVVVPAVGGTLLAAVSVLPRMVRRNRDLLKLGVAQRYNELTRRSAGSGRSPFALLTDVGRRSGRTYQTSLGAYAYGDGFILPLGYGTRTDWYRNVMAAGTCTLAWKDRIYQLERPELISGPEVVRAWPLRQRITLRLAGIDDFLWLHHKAGCAVGGPP